MNVYDCDICTMLDDQLSCRGHKQCHNMYVHMIISYAQKSFISECWECNHTCQARSRVTQPPHFDDFNARSSTSHVHELLPLLLILPMMTFFAFAIAFCNINLRPTASNTAARR